MPIDSNQILERGIKKISHKLFATCRTPPSHTGTFATRFDFLTLKALFIVLKGMKVVPVSGNLGEGHLLEGDGAGRDLGELVLDVGPHQGQVPLLKQQPQTLLQDLGRGRDTVTPVNVT